ncbi:MAG: hypothetical protein Q9227_003588 [Pyrenula ochraceoflavens]
MLRLKLDPRQFVPPSGQAFTTLAEMRRDGYKNKWKQDDVEKDVWSVWTEPKFAIGQRAVLLTTPHGNVLWDCITFLDQETVDKILTHGPLTAIIISHPHYYTTHADWSTTFSHCPIYTSSLDSSWLSRPAPAPASSHTFLTSPLTPILPSITALIVGGHFAGSLCLHYEDKLFVADTLVTVPSAHNPSSPGEVARRAEVTGRKEGGSRNEQIGHTSYAFMYSIPNMIPLSPREMVRMWGVLGRVEWRTTFGAFVGSEVRCDGTLEGRRRVVESMKVQARGMGYGEGCEVFELEA